MTNAAMYDLSIDQCINLIAVTGHQTSVLVQGHMGTGKSSILKALAKAHPDHIACYFDCTTKDLGDITIPNIAKMDDGTGYVTYLTNEELGAHNDKPIIVMVDEFGKANPGVRRALTRFLLERQVGSYTLHPDSIVFATTNLGAEGVGDTMAAHERNRMNVVRMRKQDTTEWLEWGINNDVDHALLGWVRDTPQLFQSFEDIKDPEENPYIFHPRSPRTAFVTPRSLEAASDTLKLRDRLDPTTVIASLIGQLGMRAAMDMMAFVALADKLPSLKSIKDDPLTAPVPDSAAAVCMVVYRALSALDRDWIDNWLIYLGRLDLEAQGMFANGARSAKYSKRSMVMTNKRFTEWCVANNYMFSSDVV
jgi:energy-coupling factor transporter ATP-binding protein EcfA2